MSNQVGEFERGLVDAYEGEVIGVSLFQELGRRANDVHRREIYALLEETETVTRDRLEPVMSRYGAVASPEAEAKGVELAVELSGKPWQTIWQEMIPMAEDALVRYRSLRDLGEPEDYGAVDALIAHEEALLTFAHLELSNQADAALASVREYLAGHGRGAPA
jgi:hypothetical protein